MQKARQVRLAAISSADEALRKLGNFDFVASHVFSADRRHAAVIVDMLRIIERLEELHNKVQGVIKHPYLETTLPFDMSHWWSIYLNICVTELSSDDVRGPGEMMNFLLVKTSVSNVESRQQVHPQGVNPSELTTRPATLLPPDLTSCLADPEKV